MIVLAQKVEMQCEEEGCKARLTCDIALTLSGSFGPLFPKGHGWQVLANPAQGPGSPVLTRCPAHRSALVEKRSPLSLVEQH